jgi:carboxylesterase type B
MKLLCTGLFQRAISQSSTALSGWLIQRNPKENAQQLAKFVNCPTHSSFEMVDCLKSKTSTEILNGMLQFKVHTNRKIYDI